MRVGPLFWLLDGIRAFLFGAFKKFYFLGSFLSSLNIRARHFTLPVPVLSPGNQVFLLNFHQQWPAACNSFVLPEIRQGRDSN